jgi:hypothetical protein
MAFARLIAAAALVALRTAAALRLGSHAKDNSSSAQDEIRDLATRFEVLRGEAQWPDNASVVLVPELVDACRDLTTMLKGPAFLKLGFSAAADHIEKNLKTMAECGDVTLAECLQFESQRTVSVSSWGRSSTKPAHTLANGGAPAILQDPSPAMGIDWTTRIVGFLGEIVGSLTQSESDMKKSVNLAFKRHIGSAFKGFTDSVVEAMISTALSSSVPSKPTMMSVLGGDSALPGLARLADDLLGLTGGMRIAIKLVGLDTCKKDC